MVYIDSINKGLGKLTPEVWDAFRQAAVLAVDNATRLGSPITAEPVTVTPKRVCLAKITGSTVVLAGKKYKYTWEEQVPVNGDSGATLEDPASTSRFNSTNIGEAWNLAESSNTSGSNVINGVDTSASGFPTNFALVAIPNNTVVLMHLFRDTSSVLRPYFQLQNHFAGTCDE